MRQSTTRLFGVQPATAHLLDCVRRPSPGTLALAVIALSSPAWAASVTVNTTADEMNNIIANGSCSLREAVVSMNENRDVGGCTASGSYGSGDTVKLPAGTYRLSRDVVPSFDQDVLDLDVKGGLTIDGAGLENSIIEGTDKDRAISVQSGATLTLKDLTIRKGKAAVGGGIANLGTLTLNNVKVFDNSALGLPGGGGIMNDGTLSLTDSFVLANDSSRDGGGILNLGKLTLTNTLVRGNFASERGGGIANSTGGDLTLTSSAIEANQSDQDAGGIENTAAMHATNSTVSGNFAQLSAGGVRSSGAARLTNVTVSANIADFSGDGSGDGGGIVNTGSGTMTLENSLIAGNEDRSSGVKRPDCVGTFEASGLNLVGNGSNCSFSHLGIAVIGPLIGSDASPVDAKLGGLQLNGGATPTHALLSGSPARDAANTFLCPATDQRGQNRTTDGDGDGNANCDIGAFEAPAAAADLNLDVAHAPSRVAAGSNFTYTFSVTNNGPDAAKNVKLEPNLASSLGFVSAPGGCSPANLSLSCDLGTILGGQTKTRTIAVSAPSTPGTLAFRSEVSSTTLDPTASNNREVEATLVVAPTADLRLTMTAPATVQAGANFSYTLTIANLGPNQAANLSLVDTLPAGMTFVSAQSCMNSSGTVNCTVSVLNAGASITRTIAVKAPASAATLTNAASLISATTDPTPANNSASAQTNVTIAPPPSGADLALTMTAPAEVGVGSSFAFILTATNNGPDTATGVTLADPLPAGLSFASASSGCALSSGTVTCGVGTLIAGETREITLQVTAPANPTALTDTASLFVVGPGPSDPNPANDTATAQTDVVAGAVNPPAPGIPALTATLGTGNPLAATTLKGSGSIPALQVRFEASGEDAKLERLSLSASGTGNDATDLTAVKLVLDTNGNGRADTGEATIATERFSGNDGTIDLNLGSNLTIPAGQAQHVLVTLDFSAILASRALTPTLSLSVLMLGLGLRGRSKWWLVVLAGSSLWLAGCQQTVTPPTATAVISTYQLSLTTVSAEGASSGQVATVSGLPLVGNAISIQK